MLGGEENVDSKSKGKKLTNKKNKLFYEQHRIFSWKRDKKILTQQIR